jgi:hypothetical protein
VWLTNATNQAKTMIIARVVGGTNYLELSNFETGTTSSLAGHVHATTRIIVSGVYFTA